MSVDDITLAVFEDHFFAKIDTYVPFIKEWFKQYYDHIFDGVGCYDMPPLKLADGTTMEPPPCLMYRFCMSENHSAIKGLQAFPFIQVGAMNLPRAKGGVRTLVSSIVGEGWYDYQDVYLIIKQNLVNTNNAQMFIAFITPEFYDKLPRGHYFWVTEMEIAALYNRVAPETLARKARRWASAVGRATTLRKVNEKQLTIEAAEIDGVRYKEPCSNFECDHICLGCENIITTT